jgi:alkanesulfonate monooxygenase SsuD/methylene tetrahydromethanopterin reductase-like flavin-dependent oxidoreductase (luciferase family)
MKISTVMWPTRSWPEAGELWRRAEDLGFDTAWVYDHMAWRGTTPWYDAYTTLAAAAAVTSRVRLGTLVTSPNFRHPVPTAHAAKTIDHISGGRLRLGIGSGGTARTSDSGILGGQEWTPRERADRFAEWVGLLDRLLTGPETTYEGAYYSSREVVTEPGCVQSPRVPFVIAATGPKGLRVAARHGSGWVTNGRAIPRGCGRSSSPGSPTSRGWSRRGRSPIWRAATPSSASTRSPCTGRVPAPTGTPT